MGTHWIEKLRLDFAIDTFTLMDNNSIPTTRIIRFSPIFFFTILPIEWDTR